MRTFSIFICLMLFVSLFSSCSADRHGNDIAAFCTRFNELRQTQELSPSEFFITQTDGVKTYRTYLSIDENTEILISLATDRHDEITALTASCNTQKALGDSVFSQSVADIIVAFCKCSSQTAEKLCAELAVLSEEESGVEHKCDNTAFEELSDFETSVYRTDFGTVVSVSRN